MKKHCLLVMIAFTSLAFCQPSSKQQSVLNGSNKNVKAVKAETKPVVKNLSEIGAEIQLSGEELEIVAKKDAIINCGLWFSFTFIPIEGAEEIGNYHTEASECINEDYMYLNGAGDEFAVCRLQDIRICDYPESACNLDKNKIDSNAFYLLGNCVFKVVKDSINGSNINWIIYKLRQGLNTFEVHWKSEAKIIPKKEIQGDIIPDTIYGGELISKLIIEVTGDNVKTNLQKGRKQ